MRPSTSTGTWSTRPARRRGDDVRVVGQIARNQLIRVPFVRRRAEAQHRTGLQSRPGGAHDVFAQLRRVVPESLEGLRVLELGPGRDLGLAALTVDAGATASTFDVRDYVDHNRLHSLTVDHRVDPSGTLPWPAGSFDLVWSWSVLEHVEDPGRLLRECRRVLRPAGSLVAFIDMETHLGGNKDPDRIYEFLRYPAWLWNLMTSNRSTYLNRLRLSDWRTLLTDSGFRTIVEIPRLTTCRLEDLRRNAYLAALTDEDLEVRGVLVRATLPDPM